MRGKRIILRSALPADGLAKTLVHELAHHLLHRNAGGTEADRPTFEAEGTAYAVLSYFGVDTSEYSFAYVARWAESKEVVRTSLSNVHRAVRVLVEAVKGAPPRVENAPDHRAA